MLKGPEWVAVSRGEMRGLNQPFVLSTFGKLGCEGDRFFQYLSSGFRSADPDFDTDQHLGALYMQQPQMVLRREVARMLLQGPAGYASADDDCEPSWGRTPIVVRAPKCVQKSKTNGIIYIYILHTYENYTRCPTQSGKHLLN